MQDHSKILCVAKVDRKCDKGHTTKAPCGNKTKVCATCIKEEEENQRRIKRNLELERQRQEENQRRIERKLELERQRQEDDERRIRRDLELERKRQKLQDNYRLQLQQIEDEIDHRRRTMKYESEEKKHADELKQKKEELESLRQAESNKKKMKATQKSSPPPQAAPQFDAISSAAKEWKNMKEVEGARNAALDKLMGMIGLESVKDQILSIKSTVDTKIRQGFSIGDERWSCSLLGNPGTGECIKDTSSTMHDIN